MLTADLPDTPLASYWPDTAATLDSLPDYLQEQIAEFNAPLPMTFAERTKQFLSVVAAAMKEANLQFAESEVRNSSNAPLNGELVEGMRILSGSGEQNRQLAFRAACVLKQMGLDGRSDQQLADDYGVVTTRAAAHAVRRKVERQTGLRSRSSKTDTTRERCRLRRLGKKRESAPWTAKGTWQFMMQTLAQPLQLPAPVFA
jgi:hypothetical protein